MRFEWRIGGDNTDALLTVDDSDNTVVQVRGVTTGLLEDFLNEMDGLKEAPVSGPEAIDPKDPKEWGLLVIARSDDGDILHIDPELYWNRVADWFRSRGSDPHPWHRLR